MSNVANPHDQTTGDENAKPRLCVAPAPAVNARHLCASALRRAERASLAVDECITKGAAANPRMQRRARADLLEARLCLKGALEELNRLERSALRAPSAEARSAPAVPAAPQVDVGLVLECIEDAQRFARELFSEGEQVLGEFLDGYENRHATARVGAMQTLFLDLTRELQLIANAVRDDSAAQAEPSSHHQAAAE